MAVTDDRLREIQGELNRIAEERVTELLARLRAARELTQRVAVTDGDLARHDQLRRSLEAEQAAAIARAGNGKADTSAVAARIGATGEAIKRLQKTREELLGKLSALTSELMTLGGR
jgi:hypothetical protein